MSERKVSCFYCKHYYDCELRKAISRVEDKLDDASNYLNEYFIEDIEDRLNDIYNVVAKRCRDFEYEEIQPKEVPFEEIVESVKKGLEAAIPAIIGGITYGVVKGILEEESKKEEEKQGEGENALLHKEAGDSEKQEMQIQG